MAEQTDANDLAELARYLRAEGLDVISLGLVVDLHGKPLVLGPDGNPLPSPLPSPPPERAS